MRGTIVTLAAAGLGLAGAGATLAQAPSTPQEQVAALKASIQANQQALRQYEWVETTTVSLKGEEKASFQDQCYYGVDGQLEKVRLTAPPEERRRRGLRGRIAEHKKEELTEYMKEAVALVKEYVPPDPARIQAAKDAGRVSFQPLPGPGRQVKLTITDYLKAGDSFAIDVDFASSRPLDATVSSTMDSGDPVTLTVDFDTFPDGVTFYAKDVVLDAEAESLKVEVESGGYRRTNP
jgi:hypothetical protein